MNNQILKEQAEQIEKIKDKYISHDDINTLYSLDAKVSRPAEIFAFTYGTFGSLILGTGMCLAMKVIGNSMMLGVVIGVIGIAMVSTTYPIYKKILTSRKEQYADQILELSEKILKKQV